jgi:tyrosinase
MAWLEDTTLVSFDCSSPELGQSLMYNPGIHGAGHAQIAGQMLDFLAAPGDPVFFLMHANIDRLWTIWQAKDPADRLYAIHGTRTIFNTPPSPDATLNDTISWGALSPLGKDRELWETADVSFEWLNYCYE